MPISQISVAVENKPGALHDICDIFENEVINIKGIMASSSLSPMQVHFIVDEPERAENVLKSNGYEVIIKEVIAIASPHHPGGLNAVLRPLTQENINIETLYPFINPSGDDAIIIVEVDKIKEAKEILKKHWIRTYSTEIYKS
ncbi:MAG: hypothetical protein JW864_11585 [Spirochaetes bacterium]|nr:hypothetical protein [Spirochaetota bacterium]